MMSMSVFHIFLVVWACEGFILLRLFVGFRIAVSLIIYGRSLIEAAGESAMTVKLAPSGWATAQHHLKTDKQWHCAWFISRHDRLALMVVIQRLHTAKFRKNRPSFWTWTCRLSFLNLKNQTWHTSEDKQTLSSFSVRLLISWTLDSHQIPKKDVGRSLEFLDYFVHFWNFLRGAILFETAIC